jgi:hypothetical protein
MLLGDLERSYLCTLFQLFLRGPTCFRFWGGKEKSTKSLISVSPPAMRLVAIINRSSAAGEEGGKRKRK